MSNCDWTEWCAHAGAAKARLHNKAVKRVILPPYVALFSDGTRPHLTPARTLHSSLAADPAGRSVPDRRCRPRWGGAPARNDLRGLSGARGTPQAPARGPFGLWETPADIIRIERHCGAAALLCFDPAE